MKNSIKYCILALGLMWINYPQTAYSLDVAPNSFNQVNNLITSEMKTEEIWKDVIGYEGLYQASNLGNVKSLNYYNTNNEKLLKQIDRGNGYLCVSLRKNKINKLFSTHQVITMAFLNHKPNGFKGLVVNHKNFIKTDNRVENLEIVTMRENANKKHIESTSKYIGVHYVQKDKMWIATIVIDNKNNHIGYFSDENIAGQSYKEALELHLKGLSIQPILNKYKKKYTSKFIGVSWSKVNKKWVAKLNGKYIGYFNNEIDAHTAYQNKLNQ